MFGFRESRGSPRIRGVGGNCWSTSRPRKGKGSGEVWTELLATSGVYSGVMRGESLGRLEAIEETIMDENGIELNLGFARAVVCAWLGRRRRCNEPWKEPWVAMGGVIKLELGSGLDRGCDRPVGFVGGMVLPVLGAIDQS